VQSQHPVAGPLPYPGWPIKLGSGRQVALAPAPLLGQDNAAILGLAGLGLPPAQLESLRALGII